MLRYFLTLSLALPLSVLAQNPGPHANVLVLHAALSGGATYTCAFDTTRNSPQPCADIGRMNHRLAGFQFQWLARKGDRVQLGFRSKAPQSPSSGPGRMSLEEVESQPQTRYWFTPGQTLPIDMPSVGTLAVTGEWSDHRPTHEPR